MDSMADDSEQIGQDEIEELLRQAQQAAGSSQPDPTPEPPPVEEPEEGASLGQDEIEALLNQGAAGAAQPATSSPAATKPPPPSPPPPPPPPPPPVAAAATASNEAQSQGDIEFLLRQAEMALASVDQPTGEAPPGLGTFNLKEFASEPASADKATLDLLSDVDLKIRIELGRTHMYLKDILSLRKGSVVALDKLAGDPVDVYANGRLIARGEVLVLNDSFCVRIAELVWGEEAA